MFQRCHIIVFTGVLIMLITDTISGFSISPNPMRNSKASPLVLAQNVLEVENARRTVRESDPSVYDDNIAPIATDAVDGIQEVQAMADQPRAEQGASGLAGLFPGLPGGNNAGATLVMGTFQAMVMPMPTAQDISNGIQPIMSAMQAIQGLSG